MWLTDNVESTTEKISNASPEPVQKPQETIAPTHSSSIKEFFTHLLGLRSPLTPAEQAAARENMDKKNQNVGENTGVSRLPTPSNEPLVVGKQTRNLRQP